MAGACYSYWDGELRLVCPRDHAPLVESGDHLTCDHGHQYRLADGIPILFTDNEPTHWEFECAKPEAVEQALADDRHVRSLNAAVDPYIQNWLVYTSGNLYRKVSKNLTRYPIPSLRLAEGNKKLFLDVGCNWGRWSIAAGQKGYRVVGIDPSLACVLAARRVARQMGIDAEFVVGDARHLPFADQSFDCAFSYSVLQHLSPDNAWAAVSEIRRILKPAGLSLIQMANCLGVRSLYHQARRGFGDPGFFGVRYYFPTRIKAEMQRRIGPTKVTVDGYLGLGIQAADRDLLPRFEKGVVWVSEALRRTSDIIPTLKFFADSLYFESRAERSTESRPDSGEVQKPRPQAG